MFLAWTSDKSLASEKYMSKLNRTQAPAVSEPSIVPDAAPCVQNPEPESLDAEIDEAEPEPVLARRKRRTEVKGLPEPESRDAEIDREESEVPPRKKLRYDVMVLSERVEAVEKTCAEVKRDNTATSAELARLNECVGKLKSDREYDNAAVRRDIDDIRTKLSSVTSLCRTFDTFFIYRDDIRKITIN